MKIMNKKLKNFWQVSLLGASLAIGCSQVFAEGLVPPDTESGEEAVASIQGAAGDQVDLSTLLVSFQNADLTISGNATKLPIIVNRVYDVNRLNPALRVPFTLGNWDIELPKITGYRSLNKSDGTTYTLQDDINTWSVGYCNNPVFSQGNGNARTDLFYWLGLNVEIPGAGSRELVFAKQDVNGEEVVVYPQINVIDGVKGQPEYISVDNWKATCIDLPQGAKSGFKVVAPNGTKYFFDTFSSSQSQINIDKQWYDSLGLSIYASRVEDVHGNYLTYSYESDENGGLYVSEIVASDGRIVSFEYNLVDLTGHKFWKPVGKVKLLSKVKHLSDDRSEVLSEIAYHYTNVSTDDEYASMWALSQVVMPDGNRWEYNYKDQDYVVNYEFPNSPGTSCDAIGHFTGTWSCSPTYSTLPSKLTTVNTPFGAQVEFIYTEGTGVYSNLNQRSHSPGEHHAWYVNAIGIDKDNDGFKDWTYFSRTPIIDAEGNILYNQDYLSTSVVSPSNRVDVYEIYRGKLIDGETMARFSHQLVGLPKSHKTYEFNGATRELLKEVGFEWSARKLIGDHARTCWIEDCDKPELWQKVLTKVTTKVNGQTFTKEMSEFDKFGNAQTVIENGLLNRTTKIKFKNDIESWIIGLIESAEVVDGDTKLYEYDDSGNLTKKDELGVIYEFEYYDNGLLKNGKWTKNSASDYKSINYQSYYRGTAQLENHPLSIVFEKKVNPTGTIKWEKDANGNTINLQYDALNRENFVDPAINVESSVDWYVEDIFKKVTTRGNFKEISKRDLHGREVWKTTHDITDLSTKTIAAVGYNKMGQVDFESTPKFVDNELTQFCEATEVGFRKKYDALGRLVSSEHTKTGDKQTYCYGASCNIGREGLPQVVHGYIVTDPEGFETIYNFTASGSPSDAQLSEVIQQESKVPSKYVTTSISRNKLGQVESVTRGGITRRFIYNDNFQLWKIQDPERDEVVVEYDYAGNISKKTVGAVVTNYTYNDLNLLTLISYSDDTPSISYKYDDNGNVEEVASDDIVKTYDYDELNHLVSDMLEVGSNKYETRINYSWQNFVSNITFPSGNTIQYYPNALGQATIVSSNTLANNLAEDVFFDEFGKVRSLKYANGLTYNLTRNNKHLPNNLSLLDENSVKILDYIYSYDKRSNFIGIEDTLDSNNNKVMTYDGLSQLKTASGFWGNASYEYDAAGNITSKIFGSSRISYGYDSVKNRLTSMSGGRNFGYDINGNIVSDGDKTFYYDSHNNLRNVTAPGLDVEYQYDGHKFKTIETKNDNTRYTIHNQNGALIYTIGAKIKDDSSEFVYLNGQLLARLECTTQDTDWDKDGIPGCIEKRFGGDDDLFTDAGEDFDFDGVSNLDEYNNNTHPGQFVDSDGDRMSDHWEMLFGLDWNVDDALGDLDGDGISNLDEYLNSLDPTSAAPAHVYQFESYYSFSKATAPDVWDAKFDAAGNLYLVGKIEEVGASQDESFHVSKYNDSGQLIWNTLLSSVSTRDMFSVTLIEDKVYIGGHSKYLAQLDSSTGAILQDFDTPSSVQTSHLASTSTSLVTNSYISYGTYDVDLSAASSLIDAVSGNYHLTKYDGDLNLQWTIPSEHLYGLTVDGQENIYTLHLKQLKKRSALGALVWSVDLPSSMSGKVLKLNSLGEPFVAVQNGSLREAKILRYSAGGQLLEEERYTSTGVSTVFDMDVRGENSIVVVGDFDVAIDLDDSSPSGSYIDASSYRDHYVRLSQNESYIRGYTMPLHRNTKVLFNHLGHLHLIGSGSGDVVIDSDVNTVNGDKGYVMKLEATIQ